MEEIRVFLCTNVNDTVRKRVINGVTEEGREVLVGMAQPFKGQNWCWK